MALLELFCVLWCFAFPKIFFAIHSTNIMNTKVTDQGVLIPRQWLKYVDEVEIRKENEIILVIPIKANFKKKTGFLSNTSPTSSSLPIHDPIFSLGQYPIDDELRDASINHDKYIYD